jgi:hypothetical protein
MDTQTILTTINDLRITAGKLSLLNAPLDAPKLVQQLQAAAAAFKAAAAAGDTADDRDVSPYYDNMASTLMGKSGLMTLAPFYEPIKNAHSEMATALEALAPGATTNVAERVTMAFEQPA